MMNLIGNGVVEPIKMVGYQDGEKPSKGVDFPGVHPKE
jgi:hypothetical protein